VTKLNIKRIDDSTLDIDGQIISIHRASKNHKGEYYKRGLELRTQWSPWHYNAEELSFETSSKEIEDASIRHAVLQFLNQENSS
jgi:hypothetical protein